MKTARKSKRTRKAATVPVTLTQIDRLDSTVAHELQELRGELDVIKAQLFTVSRRLFEFAALPNIEQLARDANQLAERLGNVRLEASRAETAVSRLSDLRNTGIGDDYVKTSYLHSWIARIERRLQAIEEGRTSDESAGART